MSTRGILGWLVVWGGLMLVSAWPVKAQYIVADHNGVTAFDNAFNNPADPLNNYITAASAVRILFKHASTGDYIDGAKGFGCLLGNTNADCLKYVGHTPAYDRSNWQWELWQYRNPVLISGIVDKVDRFVAEATADVNIRDYFGMKLCYLDTDSGPNVQYYLTAMRNFEQAHPGKKIIYATQALVTEGQWANKDNYASCQRVATYNNTVREYARTNGKLLYDIAAVESHDANGNLCYSTCEGMCPEYAGVSDPTKFNGHPGPIGSLRLAKAFWYLIMKSKQGGGTPSVTPPRPSVTVTPRPSATPTSPPMPAVGDVDGDGNVDYQDTKLLIGQFGKAYTAGDFNKNGRIDIWDLNTVIKAW